MAKSSSAAEMTKVKVVIFLFAATVYGQCRDRCANQDIKSPFGIDKGCGADPAHLLQCEDDGELEVSWGDFLRLPARIDYKARTLIINTTLATNKTVTCPDISLPQTAYNTSSYRRVFCYSFPIRRSFEVGGCLYERLSEASLHPPAGYTCFDYSRKNGTSIEASMTTWDTRILSYGMAPWLVSSELEKLCTGCKGTCGYNETDSSFVCYRSDAEAPRTSKSTLIALVSGGAAVFLLVVLGTCLVYLWKRRRERIKALDFESSEERTLYSTFTSARSFSYNELVTATRDFTTKIGEGGFGSVFFGTLPDGSHVAVKRLDSSNQGQKEFITEVMTIGGIHHFNLVRLIGFCSEKTHRLLVYEHVVNGSLNKWLFSQEAFLDWDVRLHIALGTARALAYLHEECRGRIIHLDVKPQNILLGDSFNVKVSDFGLAKLMSRDESGVFTTLRGTRGYLAPEWLQASITEKADVYSFGVVLLELLCGRRCLDFERDDISKVYLANWVLETFAEGRLVVEEILDERLRHQWNEHVKTQAEKVVSIVVDCLEEVPKNRLSMVTVVQKLEAVITNDVAEPPEFPVQSLSKSLRRLWCEASRVEQLSFE